MFKSLSLLSIFATCLTVSTAFGDENDLFSDVRTRAVFADTASPDTGTAPSPKRITGTENLRDMLNSAGFDAKVAGSRTVTLTKKLDPWDFPVVAEISEDESTLTITLGLRTVKEATQLSNETLISMMAASRKNSPNVFSWNSGRARTELYRVTQNKGLTGQSLRDMINRMAVVAKQNETLWAAPADEKTAPADTTTAPTGKTAPTGNTAPSTPSAVTTANLVGKWSAARSATEAFAVEFQANGNFNLVHINNGRQTKSSGRFTVTGGSLTLDGSGLKLVGKVALKSAAEFTFTAEKSAALTFTKAK